MGKRGPPLPTRYSRECLRNLQKYLNFYKILIYWAVVNFGYSQIQCPCFIILFSLHFRGVFQCTKIKPLSQILENFQLFVIFTSKVARLMVLRSAVPKKNKLYNFTLDILIELITMNSIHLCNFIKLRYPTLSGRNTFFNIYSFKNRIKTNAITNLKTMIGRFIYITIPS